MKGEAKIMDTKKCFEEPSVEVVEMEILDVITTSGDDVEDPWDTGEY